MEKTAISYKLINLNSNKIEQSHTYLFLLIYGFFDYRLIAYCRQKLEMIVGAGVRPIVVFDGERLKMKEGVEEERSK